MATAPHISPAGYRIGDLSVDLGTRQVRRDGTEIRLGKLSYRLLVTLAESAPRVVTPEILAERVWKGRFVSPPTIKQRVALLRQALGDDASQPRYVKVIRGHGYAVIPDVKPVYGHDETRRIGSPKRTGALIGVILLGILLLGYFVGAPPDRAVSIAVLPFENLSPEPGDAYFATGLHQEVIDRLDKNPDIQVISRASVRRYAGSLTVMEDVAREFDVDAIMEGTVKYQLGRVHISLQLVDPGSGVQLWSNTYERGFLDIFEIQSDIAASVAGALGVRLGVSETGTVNPEAYEAFLAGLDMMSRPNGHDRAAFFFGAAAGIDPDFAAAWAQRGFATVIKAYFAPPEEAREILNEALSYLLRANGLNPQSASAAATLGFVRYSLLDWIGAEEDFARAISLQANTFTLNQHASLLVRAGRIIAAKSEFEAAESVNRSNEQPGQLRRHVSVVQERYSEARDLVAMDQVASRRQRLLLTIALNEGNPDTIKDAISELIASQGESSPLFSALLREFDSQDRAIAVVRDFHANSDLQWPAKSYDIALFAAYFGDPELALESISADVRLTTVRLWVLWYPIMTEVRQLPAFKELVTSLGLVAYWRVYGWPDHCASLGEENFRCW